jgi:hypothetical protein
MVEWVLAGAQHAHCWAGPGVPRCQEMAFPAALRCMGGLVWKLYKPRRRSHPAGQLDRLCTVRTDPVAASKLKRPRPSPLHGTAWHVPTAACWSGRVCTTRLLRSRHRMLRHRALQLDFHPDLTLPPQLPTPNPMQSRVRRIWLAGRQNGGSRPSVLRSRWHRRCLDAAWAPATSDGQSDEGQCPGESLRMKDDSFGGSTSTKPRNIIRCEVAHGDSKVDGGNGA